MSPNVKPKKSSARPRVAIVFDCLFPINTGGGERLYGRLAEILVERGYDVDYVTRGQESESLLESPVFRVVPVWSGAIYNGGGNRSLAGALFFSLAVYRHLRQSRGVYDFVVVSATPVLNLFAAQSALLGGRTRIVGDWLEVWPLRKWQQYSGIPMGIVAFSLQSLALRTGHILTAASSFTATRLRSYRRSARPIVLGLVDLVPNQSRATQQSVETTSKPFALFVGRHIADKQLHTLPAAVDYARQTLPDLTLTIVGSGPESEAVRELVRQAGHESFVTFAGRVSDTELESLMLQASVLVNPSRREGFGLVIAEAAAWGTPSVVVASEDNAAVELIDSGINGFVADSTAAEVLGEAIKNAVEGGPPLRASTRAWFETARETHGMSASVDALLERLTDQ